MFSLFLCFQAIYILLHMAVTIDKETILSLNRGDKEAFKLLYMAYYVYLCTVSTKYVYDAEVAKEIVNDVFLNVWNIREKLVYPIKTYLIRSVQNRSLNYLRDKRIKEVALSELDEYMIAFNEEQVAAPQQPLEYLENKEFESLVSEAIDNLPDKCRDIFIQYLYKHKSYEEIAEMYNLSESTVRGQVRIALTKLKKDMGGFYPLFILVFGISIK